MKVDNPLSREFLLRYPVEAARVLESVSAEHVAAMLNELPAKTGAPVMASMLPELAAACLQVMMPLPAAKLVTELSVSSAARIYGLLTPAKQEELSGNLSDKTRSLIGRYLDYPPESAGALLDPGIDMLPENLTAAEAIRLIERRDHPVSCEIYIVDNAHHLVGMINLGKLMTSSHQARLRDIMSRKTHPISVHATASTLLTHPGWDTRRRLPVVERDDTLLGVLDYQHLRDSVGQTETINSRDPLENFLSLASLYWLSVAQLLDSVLSMTRPGEGDRK